MSFIAIAIVLHMSVVLTGIFKVNWSQFGAPGKLIAFYANLSGADGRYGFFSPNIPGQFLVNFNLKDKNGNIETKRIEENIPREVSIRYGNMLRLLMKAAKSSKLKRSITASLAAHIFNRNPNTKSVEVVVFSVILPTSKQYRNGLRKSEKEIYRAEFEK